MSGKKQVAKPVAKAVTKKVAIKATPSKVVKAVTKPKAAPAPIKKAATVAKKVSPTKKIEPAKKIAQKPLPKAVAKAPIKKAQPKPVAKAPVKKTPVPLPTKKIIAPAPKPKVAAKPIAKTVNKPVAKVIAPTPAPKVNNLPGINKNIAAAVSKARAAEKTKKIQAKAEAKKPLAMPKFNTKTVRKYEPDFTKSVLDKAPVDRGAAIIMYSDNDLMEFKELIQRKLGSAKKELAYLQGLITRKDDTGGDDSDGRYMTMEDGSLSMEREQLSQMASRQITFVDHLEKALIRIENKTYGVCRVTGKLIDKARLRAVPHATLSIEAKMNGGR